MRCAHLRLARLLLSCCAAALALLAPVAVAGHAASPTAQSVATQPYLGVTVIDRTESQPRDERIHVIQIDLTAPGLRFALSAPAGAREVRRETTLEYLRRSGAQVAINAHFFWPWPTTDTDVWVLGLAASDGRVFSAFESPEQTYAIVADAPALNIDSHNRASIVHRDPGAADGLHVREGVELWTTLAGSAQIVTDGQVTIPVYKDATHPSGVLTPGGPRNYSNEHSWYDALNARSVIGLSRDGRTLTLFTVDARGGSLGMRVGEAAEMLVSDYAVWNALNLDGGGSTSLAMVDPVTGQAALVNTSSDNPAGRAVGSSLAVFARRPGASGRRR